MSVEVGDKAVPSVASPARSGARRRRGAPAPRRKTGRAVVLQHHDYSPGEVLLRALAAHGFEPSIVRVDRGEQPPDPGALRLAIILGSDDLVEQGGHGWHDAELNWVREADRAGTAVFGVGLGAQVLSVALGGGVEAAREPQRAWIQVSTTDQQWIAPGPWLAWHDKAIRIPPTARLLAHSRTGPQAFQVNRHLGVQFHPEVTSETVSKWVASSNVTLDVQGTLEATSRDLGAGTACADRLFSAFVGSVAHVPL
jgi:GMP synthase (glutamine-hydrolysing)